ncbi:MAG: transglutaminase domain-containing protein, partial [Bacteroidaceae bacterium]|nr:transglutaminase domain-containing protein [Bacteroidaceae bacterium]
YYMLTTGSRLASGTVLAHVEFLNINADKEYKTKLVLREDTTQISVIGNMDPEMLYLPRDAKQETSILSTTGRGYFLLCCLGDTDEPTNHAVHDLKNMAGELNAWGRPILVLSDKDKPLLKDLQNLHYGQDVNGKVAKMLREGCKSERKDMPVIVLCDSFGRIVYYTEGYNTSLGENLKFVISRL